MDSAPILRNANLPFSFDHTASNVPAASTHSFFYKQYPNSPLHFTSEWTENTPPLLASNDAGKLRTGSPTRLKMSPVAHIVEEIPTPTRKGGKPNGVGENIRTPGKPGTNGSTGGFVALEKAVSGKPGTKSKVSNIDVVWAMLNDLTGKDKMAKVAQYSLRLMVHHARKTEAYLSDDKVNIRAISATYASNEKVLDLIVNFIKNPRAFAKVLVILICSVFTSRVSGFVPALGLYRQLLRFGKSPFRTHGLLEKVGKHTYKDVKANTWKIRPSFFSKATLGECILLYYNINDDIGMLYKVKFLRNRLLQRFAGRHEAYAWYCDSWFALYNAYSNLQKYTQQELDTRISIQVKQRLRTLSRQVLGATPLSEEDPGDSQTLKDIQFRITNAKLDIYKLLSDIIFNSYTVFNAKLHFDTVQIWMGISASFLGTVKLFREKKRALSLASSST